MSKTSKMSGWTRALAIVFGLFVIGVGFAAIFFPAIVVGLLTFLFSVAFIFMGLFALSMGISGQRVRMNPTQTTPPPQAKTEGKEREQGVPA